VNKANDQEMRESGETSARGEGAWNMWDAFLFGIFAGLCAAFFGVPSVLDYLAARRCGYPSFGGCFVSLGIALLLLAWLAVLCVRLFVTWPRRIRGLRRLLAAWFAAAVVLVACVVLSFVTLGPGYKSQTRGFRRYIQARADVPAMQAWLDTIDPNTCDGLWIDVAGTPSAGSPTVSFPALMLDLKPRHVQLSLDVAKRPMVRLQWGSGLLGTWGLTVGHEEMPIPKTQPREKQTLPNGQVFYNPGQYRLPLTGGAYVWHDIE
jgi:hypothetical protein